MPKNSNQKAPQKKKSVKKTLGYLLKRYEDFGTLADTYGKTDPTPRFVHENFYFMKPHDQTGLVRNLSEFVVFDTETTGLNELGNDLPFEITFIRFDLSVKGLVSGKLTVRIDPAECPDYFAFDSAKILEITHVDVLSPEFLEKCVPMETAAKQILAFLGNTAGVFAHNGGFDANIMNNLLRRSGVFPKSKISVFDTVEIMDVIYNKMARVSYPAKNLDFILRCVLKDEIDEKLRHTSEYDVLKTAKFLIKTRNFVLGNEKPSVNEFARFEEFAKDTAKLGRELLALDDRYLELERKRKALALGIRNFFKGTGSPVPEGWYVELGKDGRQYLKKEYEQKGERYGYRLKRMSGNELVPMNAEMFGKDKDILNAGVRAVHVEESAITEALKSYDSVRREKDMVGLEFKSLKKNAMKYMNNAENMSKGYSANDRRKNAVSDINFGNTGMYGKYEAIEDGGDYVPNSDKVVLDIVSGKIQSFDDLYEKTDYFPDPVVWELA